MLAFSLPTITWGQAAPHPPPLSPAHWAPIAQPTLAEQYAKAPALKIEDVMAGPDSVWVIGPWWVPHADGKGWDLVVDYCPEYMGPHEFVFLDTATGQLRRQAIKREGEFYFMFHLVPTFQSDGKLRWLAYANGKNNVWEYDSAKKEMTFRGYPLGDEVRGGNWVQAPNGDFYAITGGKGTNDLVYFHVEGPSLKAEQLARTGPANPNLGWLYADSILDGDWVYTKVGKQPWRLFAFNVQTRESRTLAETESIIGDYTTIRIGKYAGGGCTAAISNLKGDPRPRVEFWLRDGKLTEKTGPKPPWPEEKTAKAPSPAQVPRPDLLADSLRPDMKGNVTAYYRLPLDASQGPPVYGDWKNVTFQVTRHPATLARLVELPSARMIGLSDGYGEVVLYDLDKKTREGLGDSRTSVYSAVVAGDKAYLAGYPSSMVFEFDPARPWTMRSPATPQTPAATGTPDAAPGSNPRFLAQLGDYCHLHTPFAGALGADSTLYFAGKIIRVGDGGGLGWYSLREQKGGGIYKPFSAFAIYWMCSASDGKFLLCSTKPVVDDANPRFTPKQAKLFIFDTAKKEIAGDIELKDQAVPGYVAEALPGLVMGYARSGDKGFLYGVDVEQQKVLWTKDMPAAPVTTLSPIRKGQYAFHKGPDGQIYTFLGSVLARIDPATAAVTILGKAPAPCGIAFCRKEIYLTGATQLRHCVMAE